jgi:signal transduction histidine kinase
MAELIVKKSGEVLRAQASALALLGNNSMLFTSANGVVENWQGRVIEPDNSTFWKVVREGVPLIIPHETQQIPESCPAEMQSDCRSLALCVLVPLKSGSVTTGVLFLGYTDRTDYTETQQRLASIIAEMAGNALNRMNVAETLEKLVEDRSRNLETIYCVTALSTQAADLKSTLQTALRPIAEAVNAQLGAVVLTNETDRRLRLVAEVGLPEEVKNRIRNADYENGLEASVLKQKRPIVLPDLTVYPHIGHKDSSAPAIPFVAMPMRVAGGIVGILEIARFGGVPFDLEEVTLLSFIADHLGLVVENDRLLRQAEKEAVLEERSRLARELHDSITQSLYSATLFAEGGRRLAERGDIEQVKHYLSQLGEISQQALKEMRLMVFELRSPALQSQGLVRALQHRIDAVEMRSGIQAELDAGRLPKLNERVETALYRIALEALNNSLKHACAKSVTVSIRRKKQEIVLYVYDDGKGTDLDAAWKSGGLGLISMRERAERLQGKLEIHSTPGSGLGVVATLPLHADVLDEDLEQVKDPS